MNNNKWFLCRREITRKQVEKIRLVVGKCAFVLLENVEMSISNSNVYAKYKIRQNRQKLCI